MKLESVSWSKNRIKIIDQSKLPLRLEYLYIADLKTLWKAIRTLKVRGAPALGAAASIGVYLGARNSRSRNPADFRRKTEKALSYLASSRPTARNLFYGLERMRRVLERNKGKPPQEVKKLLLREALAIIKEDMVSCRRIGACGARLINDNDAVLTICNSGVLATVDYGTALGALYRSKEEGKDLKVFACETRPLMQGSRLTAWELKRSGIDVTIICDSMAAALMRQGRISKVIVGADRIAANGDTANKIGTYNLAVMASYHKVPFYVTAPASTFDIDIKSGNGIVIEERPQEEVTQVLSGQRIAPSGVKVFNPAFDVTPHVLISAIITDNGVIRAPYSRNIKRLLRR
ncbi:MAG: S-methyl-5-thioribose-1-phosphate isomerase [Candidatus Omnitrophota bacterium]